jgi:hypothetical protein
MYKPPIRVSNWHPFSYDNTSAVSCCYAFFDTLYQGNSADYGIIE